MVEVPRTVGPLVQAVNVPRTLASVEVAERALGDPEALWFILSALTRHARENILQPTVRGAALELARILQTPPPPQPRRQPEPGAVAGEEGSGGGQFGG